MATGFMTNTVTVSIFFFSSLELTSDLLSLSDQLSYPKFGFGFLNKGI